MTHIIPKEVRHNSFDKETFGKIKSLLENIPSDLYETKNTGKILELIRLQSRWAKQQMMWVVSIDPAYFLQYKKNSCALFVINEVTVIAYRPKYLEYPQMVDFPVLDKTECPVKVELVSKGQGTPDTLAQATQEFIERIYAKLYGTTKTAEFQTDLVKNVKYYLSKTARVMYWHVILGTHKTELYRWEEFDNSMKFRINQNKYLYLYSLKGVHDPIANLIQNKWKQLISFILLFILLLSVVMCPNSKSTDPIPQAYSFESPTKAKFCSHRTEIYYGIGGFFFLLTGMKIANRKKPKLPKQQ